MASLRIFLSVIFILYLTQLVQAQKRTAYYITVKRIEGKRVVGQVAAIREKGLEISMKRRSGEANFVTIPFDDIQKLELHQNAKNLGLLILGGGGIAGSVALGLGQSDPLLAAAIIVGGTIVTVGICAVIYNLVNPPVVSLRKGEDQIDYNTVKEALKVYVSENKVAQ